MHPTPPLALVRTPVGTLAASCPRISAAPENAIASLAASDLVRSMAMVAAVQHRRARLVLVRHVLILRHAPCLLVLSAPGLMESAW